MTIETEIGKVTLKEFINYGPDYIRIYPKENKLYGIAKNVNVSINGKKKIVQADIETEIKISFNVRDSINGESDAPNMIHLHGSNADTFLTLLALKPESLYIAYYHKQMTSNWETNHNLNVEGIFIEGQVKTKTYKISIETNYDSKYGKLARWESY